MVTGRGLDPAAERGLVVIRQIVVKMGFGWRPPDSEHVDGGLDVPAGRLGAVGGVVWVRSYPRDHRFNGENERRLHVMCARWDIEAWVRCPDPVIVVCVHPNPGWAWWAHAQPAFDTPAARMNRRVDIVKRDRRFIPSAHAQLRALLPTP